MSASEAPPTPITKLPFGGSAQATGSPIKVFALDDTEWWAGQSLEECLKVAQEQAGEGCYDDPDYHRELTPDDMQRLVFVDHDGTRRSFAEELERRLSDRGEKFPQMFAAEDW